jgi:hypothetical protein
VDPALIAALGAAAVALMNALTSELRHRRAVRERAELRQGVHDAAAAAGALRRAGDERASMAPADGDDPPDKVPF